MNKEIFKEIKNLKMEYEDIENRIREEENKVLIDSVQGSSTEYPYNQHSCRIEGIQNGKKYRRYLKMLNNKKRAIGKKILNFEYEMNYIQDSEIRTLLRLKYIDGFTNNQIAHRMNEKSKNKEYTEDSVRMQIKRFFEKNL